MRTDKPFGALISDASLSSGSSSLQQQLDVLEASGEKADAAKAALDKRYMYRAGALLAICAIGYIYLRKADADAF